MSEAQTLTLTDFLLARISEDEEWIEIGRRWLAGLDYGASLEPGATACIALSPMEEPGGPYDPERLVAECAAKRRIVERHGEFGRISRNESGEVGVDFVCSDPRSVYELSEDCADMRALAAVYADHPDYRPEWRS